MNAMKQKKKLTEFAKPLKLFEILGQFFYFAGASEN